MKTDQGGRFNYVLTEAGEAHLVVQAQRFAPAYQSITIEPGVKPLEVELGPGLTLKGRVLDEEGNAVRGAAISVLSWNKLPLLSWRTQSDAEGRFTWNAAPSEPIILGVSKPGFKPRAQQVIASTEGEINVRLERR